MLLGLRPVEERMELGTIGVFPSGSMIKGHRFASSFLEEVEDPQPAKEAEKKKRAPNAWNDFEKSYGKRGLKRPEFPLLYRWEQRKGLEDQSVDKDEIIRRFRGWQEEQQKKEGGEATGAEAKEKEGGEAADAETTTVQTITTTTTTTTLKASEGCETGGEFVNSDEAAFSRDKTEAICASRKEIKRIQQKMEGDKKARTTAAEASKKAQSEAYELRKEIVKWTNELRKQRERIIHGAMKEAE